jgi:hypothetical protein
VKSRRLLDEKQQEPLIPLWSGILAFRHFEVRHSGNFDDKESGHSALKTSKSPFQHFGIPGFGKQRRLRFWSRCIANS